MMCVVSLSVIEVFSCPQLPFSYCLFQDEFSIFNGDRVQTLYISRLNSIDRQLHVSLEGHLCKVIFLLYDTKDKTF